MLEEALELFTEGGVEAVKTETVAKRSGVMRATVYRRYPRREDLVIAAIAEAYRVHLEQPVPENPTLAETISGIAGALADARVRRVLRRLMSVPHDHPELYAEYRAKTGAPRRDEVIQQVLDQEAMHGNFPARSDIEMVQTLFAASISSHLLTRPDDEPFDRIVAFLYRVLAALGHHPVTDDAPKESS